MKWNKKELYHELGLDEKSLDDVLEGIEDAEYDFDTGDEHQDWGDSTDDSWSPNSDRVDEVSLSDMPDRLSGGVPNSLDVEAGVPTDSVDSLEEIMERQRELVSSHVGRDAGSVLTGSGSVSGEDMILDGSLGESVNTGGASYDPDPYQAVRDALFLSGFEVDLGATSLEVETENGVLEVGSVYGNQAVEIEYQGEDAGDPLYPRRVQADMMGEVEVDEEAREVVSRLYHPDGGKSFDDLDSSDEAYHMTVSDADDARIIANQYSPADGGSLISNRLEKEQYSSDFVSE